MKVSALVTGTAILVAGAMPAKVWLSELLLRQGLQAKNAGRADRAIRRMDWALRLNGDLLEARMERALLVQQQGDALAARRVLDELVGLDFGDSALRARFLLVDGSNLFRIDKMDAALERFAESASLARELGEDLFEARALLESSYVLQYSLHRSADALDVLRQALEIARGTTQADLFEAEALAEIGQIRWLLHRDLDEPLTDYYLPALEIFRQHKSDEMIAHVLGKVSFFHMTQGNLFEFFRYGIETLEIQERLGNAASISEAHMTLGRGYSRLGNHRKAHQHLKRSLEASRQIGDRFGHRRAAWTLAASYLRLGLAAEAIKYLEQNDAPDNKTYWSYLGHAYLGQGEIVVAQRHFEKSLAMERQSGGHDPTSQLAILTGLARCRLRAADVRGAARRLREAEPFLKSVIDWGALSAYQQVWADLYDQQGRHDEALAHLIEAAEIENRTFGSLPDHLVWGQSRDLHDRLFAALLDAGPSRSDPSRLRSAELVLAFLEEARYHAFRDLVVPWPDSRAAVPAADAEGTSALLERIRQTSTALRERRDPAAVDALRRAYSDYEDRVLRETASDPRYRLIRRAQPVELAEVRRALAPDVALFVYVFVRETTYALVLTRSAFEVVELPVTRQQLAPKVKLFRHLVFGAERSGAETPRTPWQPLARDLHRVLVSPIESRGLLSGIRRIGLIPYGLLHDVPFAALLGPVEEPRFLIERYSLFRTPSASFLSAGHGSPPRGAAEPEVRRRTMLAFGLRDAAEPGLSPLAFAAAEATAVAGIYDGEVRVDARATERELKRLAPRFRILHLAAHSVAEPEMPLLSRLLLRGGEGDDGSLSVREIFTLDMNADLVTLSACRTGLSFPASGRRESDFGRTGFIEAFLHAGAASVLASLLPVSDQPTMELMRVFYTNLRTTDPVEALAEAQRAMIRGSLSYRDGGTLRELRHPRFWAPFVLVGRDR